MSENYKCDDGATDAIFIRALNLVKMAESMGVILTIEHHPDKPLSMGNTFPVITVRPARHRKENE